MMAELAVHEQQRCIDTFRDGRPLHESFPVVLDNGVTVPTPQGVCSQCRKAIAPDDVRGRVSWPIPAVAVVEAAGLCRPCERMTQLHVRFRAAGDTFRAEAPLLKGRGWVAVQPPPPSAWWRFRRWLVQRLR